MTTTSAGSVCSASILFSLLRGSSFRRISLAPFLVELEVKLDPRVGLPQQVDRFGLLVILSLDQLHFRVDVLQLVLEDLDIVFGCSHVVFKFSFHIFMSFFLELEVFDLCL